MLSNAVPPRSGQFPEQQKTAAAEIARDCLSHTHLIRFLSIFFPRFPVLLPAHRYIKKYGQSQINTEAISYFLNFLFPVLLFRVNPAPDFISWCNAKRVDILMTSFLKILSLL